jgi:hypothetical protein
MAVPLVVRWRRGVVARSAWLGKRWLMAGKTVAWDLSIATTEKGRRTKGMDKTKQSVFR